MPQALGQHKDPQKIIQRKNQWHVQRNSSDQIDAGTKIRSLNYPKINRQVGKSELDLHCMQINNCE